MTKSLWSLFYAVLLLQLSSIPVASQPLNLRHPAPSPDGLKICFSYQGDLWVVSSQGGKADRLTVHIGYDAYPKWSPDGNSIAFSSQRFGNFDVYVISATGGEEARITYHSADDIVSGWSSDSRKILFTSNRELGHNQVWEVNASGGRARPLTQIASRDGRRSPDNTKLLFTRGEVPWWQKGYHGSASSDLFVKDFNSGSIQQVTANNGNDLDAFWSPSGSEIIYISDSTGIYNVFKKNLVSGQVSQLSNHRLSASHLGVSNDASLAAYELGGEIFLYDLKSGAGRKLTVDASAAMKTNLTERIILDSGATDFAISPDGQLVAYVIRGEVFCRNLDGSSQRQLTSSAALEREISWSPDSRQIAFTSDLDFSDDIYLARSTDPSQTSLAISHDIEIAPMIKSDQAKRQPVISPDQSKIAFVRSETDLVATDLKRMTERVLSGGNPIGSYDWSPDGRYVVFTQLNADWYNELFIGDSESGTIYRVSENPGNFQSPHFSSDGRFLYYVDNGDIFYLYLERRLSEMSFSQRRSFLEGSKPSTPMGLPTVMIDFDDIDSRSVRLTHLGDVEEAVLSPNSYEFVYSTTDHHIETISLDGSNQKLLTTSMTFPSRLQFALDRELVFFKDASGRLYSISLQNTSVMAYPFRAEIEVDHHDEFLQSFSHTWQLLNEKFHDPTMNQVDWNEMRDRYRPRVDAVTEENDLYDILREMMGELNASHLNIWTEKDPRYETGYLGIIPDFDDNSSGLKVKSIIPRSPATMLNSQLRLEDKITGIEGRKLNSNTDYYQALEGTAGKEIKLDIFSRDGISRSVGIIPISSESFQELAYQDRVVRRRELVDKLSDRKIGYVHLQHTDGDGVAQFASDLAKYTLGKSALVLDIRGNVGGANHDKLLECLSRRTYITHKSRYGSAGSDSPGAIDIPILLLIDERTSSDAEIFAQGFRELNLGTIAGTTTYGAVLGGEPHQLLDGATLTIPSVGWYTLKGDKLENSGVSPDLPISSDLTRLERDEDNQLEDAVKALVSRTK